MPPVALQLDHLPSAAGAGGGIAGTLRLAARLPEPGHFWIRYAPRSWEGPRRPWLDLAAGRIGRSGRQALTAPGPSGQPPLDDLLYLPPVPERLAGPRDALARQALAGGAPVLVQLLPGDDTSLAPGEGAVLVIDLLAALLAGELDCLPPPPAGAAAAVWPLLPGLAGDPDLWESGCQRLAAAGLGQLQALVPALGAGDRRRLAATLGEGSFDALFHRQPPAERDLARVAHRHGLAPFLPRPLPRPPLLRAGNRRIAGLLALAAELWLRVGRPVGQAHSLFRAARWLDSTAYDVDALSREGNLAAVTALDPLARRAVIEATGGGEPALVAELLAEYLG
jgi:hypothetical protein